LNGLLGEGNEHGKCDEEQQRGESQKGKRTSSKSQCSHARQCRVRGGQG
jgi:hypothetical protein